jgi:hypothetical protein
LSLLSSIDAGLAHQEPADTREADDHRRRVGLGK